MALSQTLLQTPHELITSPRISPSSSISLRRKILISPPNPNFLSPQKTGIFHHSSLSISNPNPNPNRPHFLISPRNYVAFSTAAAAAAATFIPSSPELTRVIATISALAAAVAHVLANKLRGLAVQGQGLLVGFVWPFLLAALGSNNRPADSFITPLRNLASRWLDIYSKVILIRLLLSWFPNVHWDKQPFSAVRHLCDPYLRLFSKVLPPINGLDFSSLLAFIVLGVVGSIISNNKAGPTYSVF